MRRRQEAEDALDSAIAQQRSHPRGWSGERVNRAVQTHKVGAEEEEKAQAAASEVAKAKASAVAAAAVEARAAADADADVRVAEVTAAHAAALAEVRRQLDLAEGELAEERRYRKAIEHAAKQGAHEAMAEQQKWRAAAAEGWLTAGREAKRRQQTQLARMSDMLQLGGGPLVERTNAAEPSPSTGGGGGPTSPWELSPRRASHSPAAAASLAPSTEAASEWRATEMRAMQMAGGSPAATAPRPARSSLATSASAHAIGSPMGPARGARPPRSLATPKTRGAELAAAAAGAGTTLLGAPLPTSAPRPPRVRYEDTGDLD